MAEIKIRNSKINSSSGYTLSVADSSAITISDEGYIGLNTSPSDQFIINDGENDYVYTDKDNNRFKIGASEDTTPSKTLEIAGSINIDKVEPADQSSFSLSPSSGGNLNPGGHYEYGIVFVTAAGGETPTDYGGCYDDTSNMMIDLGPDQNAVEITNIPTSSDPRVVARKIYRTEDGGNSCFKKYVDTINDNTTTSYTDTTSDSNLDDDDRTYRKDNTTGRGIYIDNTVYATLGIWNIGFGENTLSSLTTGYGNFSFSRGGLKSLTTGTKNIAIGSEPMSSMQTGSDNIGIGYSALSNSGDGSYNTIVGSWAGRNNDAGWGDAHGYRNTVLGYYAFYDRGASDNDVVALGARAGTYFQGNRNIFIGAHAGNVEDRISGGDSNIIIGYRAAQNANDGAEKNIIIGNQVDLQDSSGSNQLSIGNLIFGTGVDGTGTTISDGKVGIKVPNPNSTFEIDGNIEISGSSSGDPQGIFEDFVSGISSASGWRIDYDGSLSELEIDNIIVRNTLRTHIFQKDVVKATNGTLYVSDSGVIDEATSTQVTFRSDKSASFSVGDELWVKDADNSGAIKSIKFTIDSTASAPTYDVTYTSGSYSDIEPGMTAVRTNGATIEITASLANSPYINFSDSDSSGHTRIGNLDGINRTLNGVTVEGDGLFSENAFLTGTIVSSSGSVGGFDIYAHKLLTNSQQTGIQDSTNTYAFFAGDSNPASADFSVKHDGTASIAGTTINSIEDGADVTADNAQNWDWISGEKPEQDADNTERHAVDINHVGDSPPSSPSSGTVWCDTSANPDTLKRWTDGSWTDIATWGSPWTGVVDDDGNKPNDNATVGANLLSGSPSDYDVDGDGKISNISADIVTTGVLDADNVIVRSADTTTFKLDKNDLTINTNQFTLDSSGNADFSGSLSAASGTFSGSLDAVDGTFSGSLSAASGKFTGYIEVGSVTIGDDADGSNNDGIYFDNGDHWLDNNTFQLGGSSGIVYDGSLTIGSDTTIEGSIFSGNINAGSSTITGGVIRTADPEGGDGSQQAIVLDGGVDKLRFYDSDGNSFDMYGDSNLLIATGTFSADAIQSQDGIQRLGVDLGYQLKNNRFQVYDKTTGSVTIEDATIEFGSYPSGYSADAQIKYNNSQLEGSNDGGSTFKRIILQDDAVDFDSLDINGTTIINSDGDVSPRGNYTFPSSSGDENQILQVVGGAVYWVDPDFGGSYTHPTYNGDDFDIDTSGLTGATVISDLDINLVSDSSGHVVDANASVNTRNLNLLDLGDVDANPNDNDILVWNDSNNVWNSEAKYTDSDAQSAINGTTPNLTGLQINGNTLIDSNADIQDSSANTILDYSEGKVYNAVWNDIADFIPYKDDELEYGKCYYRDKNGNIYKTNSYKQKGLLGIASDTYGFGVGGAKKEGKIPIAISGFVLAYVDREYVPGTPLTSTKKGYLTKMDRKDLMRYPERIVATFDRPEEKENFNGVQVNGRHWVKVK